MDSSNAVSLIAGREPAPPSSSKILPRIVKLLFVLLTALASISPALAVIPLDSRGQLDLLKQSNAPLPAADAFKVGATLSENGEILVTFSIADGYYLYKDKLRFEPSKGSATAKLPEALTFDDPIFGAVEIYRGDQSVRVTLDPPLAPGETVDLTVVHQGCSDRGVCYSINASTISLTAPETSAPTAVLSSDGDERPTVGETVDADERDRSTLSLLAFFGLGLLMAATPCLFPLMPVVLTLVSGPSDDTQRHWPRLVAYTVGFLSVYVVVGAIAAASGHLISSLFQSTAFLVGCAILYAILGLSMFGFWSIDLSRSHFAAAIDGWIRRQRPSAARGLVMGVFSALLATPCVSAPLAGVLLAIAQSGDVLRGMTELAVLGLGIVTPLILLALFGKRWLPKGGFWLVRIQRLLGLVLFTMGLLLIEPLIGPIAFAVGVFALIVATLAVCGLFSTMVSPLRRGIQLIIVVAALAVGLNGILDALKDSKAPLGIPIASSAELDSALDGRAALVFFTADWCRYCISVADRLRQSQALSGPEPTFRLFIVDLTHPDPQTALLVSRFDVFGPPTIVLVQGDGRHFPNDRIIGTTTTGAIDALIERAQTLKRLDLPL